MMLVGCITNIVDLIGGERLALSILSLAFAVLTLYALKKYELSTKLKIGIIYSHLFFLSFPAVLFTTNLACGSMCMPCQDNTYALIGYALPSTLALATIAGFVVIPSFYIVSHKRMEISDKELLRFVHRHARRMKIKKLKLYAIDRAKPLAFSFRSFRSAIFLSVGLLDVMNRKEIEAVLLHELAHLQRRSSALKLSHALLRLSPLSLLARFHHDAGEEERRTDAFVVRQQKTERYLLSAKRKMDAFCCHY
ncbi:MAG: M48 family metalloprotease [Candidatus Aenigmarchaeota archaeon]|nr:M48 family metalloprotease [Candidatus Aenigmarchaeota archaeon]